jgi:hypothetical protein
MLTLKTTFENDTRRRQFGANGSLANLKSVVRELYGVDGSALTLKYVDDDGDLITLGSEAEMRECVTIAEKKNGGVMRVSVFRADSAKPEVVVAAAAAPEAAAATVKDESDDDSDDDDDNNNSTNKAEEPFAALQTFFDALVQGEEGEFVWFDFFLVVLFSIVPFLSGTKVRTFFEQLGEQLGTQLQATSERVQREALPHVKKIRLALEELLARGVVTRDTFRDVSEAIVAAPQAVQDFVLSLVTLIKQQNVPFVQQQQSFVRHAATCDGCNTPIVGVRFKCVNCADYDLCAQCEARNVDGAVHERTHAFLKLPFAVPLGVGQLLPNLRPLAGGFGGAGRCGGDERRRRCLMMCPYMQQQRHQQQHQPGSHAAFRHAHHHQHSQPVTIVVPEDFVTYSWFKKNCTRENADDILKVNAFFVFVFVFFFFF